MNKQKKAATFKQIENIAQNLEEVARQLQAEAARLKSEAISARVELGNNTGRGRKAQDNALPIDVKLGLMASLTKGAGPRKTNT